ncbi:MAG: pyridoxamine 5'-phosphate oxidase, partial [Limnohabitans sp.]|nr:pyridoxamine 5'-phosphate oxidase [Limnohabitans sp.]
KNYQQAELLESQAAAQPLPQFTLWLNQALSAQIPEANAMTLATVASDLRPSTRIVLVKAYDEQGIVWFTNFDSRKGRELAGNPYAALQFHWVELERVVRIEGRVEKISDADSDAYYHSRPLESRIGAWASPQSQAIASREWLQQALKTYADKFGPQPPRPPHWGGYRLVPDRWEFWQGGCARLHDRLQYRKHEDNWVMGRLAP